MRVLSVGMGSIARKAYLPVLAALPDLEIHICSRNAAVMNATAAHFGVRYKHLGLENALSGHRYDAFFVHAATVAHREVLESLIPLGIPILIDKPLAERLDDVDYLLGLAARCRTFLMVGFNRRFAPAYRQMRADGTEHILFQKHRRASPAPIRHAVFDDFIHVLDTLRFLGGEMERPSIEIDSVEGILRSVSVSSKGAGPVAIGIMHRTAGIDEERLDIVHKGCRSTLVDFQEANLRPPCAVVDPATGWTTSVAARGFGALCEDFLDKIRCGQPTAAADIYATHALCELVVRTGETRS